MSTRELIAYGLIVAIAVVGIPSLIALLSKRRKEKRRRRGIKDYNRDGSSRATSTRGYYDVGEGAAD